MEINNIPIARVKSVHFCMQSSDEVRKQSVCRVFNPEAMDRNKQVPNSGGVLDPRMGSIDRRFDCSTCGNDYVNCPGHFGHIDLPCPFYSHSFISRTYALLRSVCYFCSRLLVGRDDFRAFQVLHDKDVGGLVSKNTFSGITKAAKTKRICPYEDCGMPQPKYDLDKMIITIKWDPTDIPILIDKGWRHVSDRMFTPKDAQLILQAVDDKDYEFLGLDPVNSHPSWSVFTAYPVIPPNVRPAEGPKRGQDDLTILLEHIVNSVHNINDQMQKNLPKWVPLTWTDLNAWFAKHKDLANLYDPLNYGAPSETWQFPPPDEQPPATITPVPAAPAAPKRRGRKSANHAAIQNLSGSTSISLTSFVPFKTLVQTGPRDNHPEDVLRLMPFVLWAFGWCGEDSKIINDIPVFRNSVLEPNDEIVAWLWESFTRPCLELQCHLTVIVNNDGRSIPQNMQSSGAQFKSIVARLNTKTGRIRGHLMGKRIDFTARSVISPGAELDVNEVGVPGILATILSVPETVNKYNEKRLADSVRIGHGKDGGATRVITSDGCITYLEFLKDQKKRDLIADNLTQGWIVERHLIDGDIVLFNRQPSLHKMSIMGHKVKILPQSKSFELPLPDTTCYNADFDGDEMNMHVLQTPESRSEALALIEVSNYFVSPQCHRAIIALVQNALLASYLFTIKDAFFDKEQVSSLLANVKYPLHFTLNNSKSSNQFLPPGAILKPKELWTGKQIYSWFLHPEIQFFKDTDPPASKIKDLGCNENRIMHFSEPTVLIRNGELLTGRLCKKTVGATQGSIIDILVRDVSNEAVVWFLSDIQRVMSNYLKMRGFTVGIADCLVSSKTMNQTKSILQTLYDLPQPGKEEDGEEEYILKKTTSAITDIANRLVMSELLTSTTRGTENAFLSMITSGSKGKVTDFETVITCVGQQLANGHRIRRDPVQGYAPYFKPSERHIMASGFLNHSHTHGLSPREMYDHFMGGREGLVDTAVKTADTGYTQRRLVKMMENLRIATDLTVREADGIVQFCYGATGTNPARYEWVKTKGAQQYMSEETLIPTIMEKILIPSCNGNVEQAQELILNDIVIGFINEFFSASSLMSRSLASPLFVDDVQRQYLSPINWDRIYDRAQYKKESDVLSLMERMYETRDSVYPGSFLELLKMITTYSQAFIQQVGPCETSVTRFLMFEKFLDNYEYSLEFYQLVWPYVFLESKRQWIESRCNPGDMVGIISAQSIGEPTTQMTLRTSHTVGKESETLQSGVPRMKEIIDMSEHMSTPSMTIPVITVKKEDLNLKNLVGSQLSRMVRTFKIIKEPIGEESCDDGWLLLAYKYFGDEVETDFDAIEGCWLNEDLYNTNLMATSQDYVCRLVLKSKEVHDIQAVAYRIKKFWQEMAADIWDSIQVYYSPLPIPDDEFNDLVYIVRIRACGIRILADKEVNPGNFEKFRKVSERYLCIHLRKIMQRAIRLTSFGIDEIKRARPVEEKKINKTGGVDKVQCIRTLGSSINSVASIPFLDWYNSVSNNIPEVYRELGIGAARTVLISELTKVLGCDGGYVLFTHIWMLVDTLTFRGFPMRANRHGQNRVNTGVLQRCSFEESASILQDSAFFSEKDGLSGLTPNLMVGQIAPIGTGTIGLRSREDKTSWSTRDNLSYVLSKGFSTPREERIDKQTGQAMPYRKVNMTEKVKYDEDSFSIPVSFSKEKTSKYWMENASARSILRTTDARSFIRTDKTTADVLVDLTSGGYAPNKRVRFEENTNQEWEKIMDSMLK